ncbi:MAG: Flagellar biosynthesis protein FliQ, partial [uncultured Lysobacter sp.]
RRPAAARRARRRRAGRYHPGRDPDQRTDDRLRGEGDRADRDARTDRAFPAGPAGRVHDRTVPAHPASDRL